MNLVFFIILSSALLVSVEVLKRKLFVSNDLSRRIAHMGAGAINIAAPLYVSHVATLQKQYLLP